MLLLAVRPISGLAAGCGYELAACPGAALVEKQNASLCVFGAVFVRWSSHTSG